MTIYFTSDLHFNHKLCSNLRGFGDDTAMMNEAIIGEWNSNVCANDRVYILGDVGFGSQSKLHEQVSRLNGRKYLIRGNHDRNACKPLCADAFTWIRDVSSVSYTLQCDTFGNKNGKISFFLSHYAHRTWPWSHNGVIHLYGHSHGNLPDDPRVLAMDVGIDAIGMLRPISAFEVLTRLMTMKSPEAFKGQTRRNELPPL